MARKAHKSLGVGAQGHKNADDVYRKLLPTGGGKSCYIVLPDGRLPHVAIGSEAFYTYLEMVDDARTRVEIAELAETIGGEWQNVRTNHED